MFHIFHHTLKSSRLLRIFCTTPIYYDKNFKPKPRYRALPFLWFYALCLLFLFSVIFYAAQNTIMDQISNNTITKFAVHLVKLGVTMNILIVTLRRKERFTKCMNLFLHHEELVEKMNIKMKYRWLIIFIVLCTNL